MQTRFTVVALACLAVAACSRASDRDTSPSNPDADRTPAVQAGARATAPIPTPPEPIDDGAITRKVEASLRKDPALAGADISVNTTRGVVNLTGLVSSQEQAALAAGHGHQDGVVRVDNDLAVDLR